MRPKKHNMTKDIILKFPQAQEALLRGLEGKNRSPLGNQPSNPLVV